MNKRRVSDLFDEGKSAKRRFYKDDYDDDNDQGIFQFKLKTSQKENLIMLNVDEEESYSMIEGMEDSEKLKKNRCSLSDDYSYSQDYFGKEGGEAAIDNGDDYPDNNFEIEGNHVWDLRFNSISNKLPIIEFKDIDFKEFVGKGNFSDVWSARWDKEDEEDEDSMVAVKILKKGNTSKQEGSSIKADMLTIETLMQELEILRKVNEDGNEYVLKLIGFCQTPQSCILTELMEFTLYDLLHFHPKNLQLQSLDKAQISIALQISRGIMGINEKSMILHNDLTSKNILLRSFVNTRGETDFIVKISDFGLSSFIDSSIAPTKRGNARWRSPEQTLSSIFSKKGEVWSFGVIFWEILTQQLPYSHIKESKAVAQMVASKTLALEIPSSLPPILFDLINDCLIYDHDKRTSISNVVTILSKYYEFNFQEI